MDGDNTSATVQPSPPSWTSLTLDDLAAIALTQGQEPAEGEEGRATDTAASMSEEERKRRRPLRQRGESSFTSPFALCHHNSVPAAAKQGSGSGVNVDEVVISSVIGYALVRLEAHKDKITASTLEKPLSAADLLELNELQEVLSGNTLHPATQHLLHALLLYCIAFFYLYLFLIKNPQLMHSSRLQQRS
jgi:hypothetical protein